MEIDLDTEDFSNDIVVETSLEEEVIEEVEVLEEEVTSMGDYDVVRPEFGNMTEAAIRQWLAFNPNIPSDEVIEGHTVKIWQMARKFNRKVADMEKLAKENDL